MEHSALPVYTRCGTGPAMSLYSGHRTDRDVAGHCEMEPCSTRAVDPGNQVVCWERATLMPCVCTIAAPASLTSLTGVAVP